MSRFLCAVFFFCFWCVVPARVLASEFPLELSAISPNPIGTDTNIEWVEVLNSSTASVSAEGYWIRDGNGTPKSILLSGMWLSGERKPVLGLSLNNDTDWVELWHEDTLIEVSEPYPAAAEGAVWKKQSSGTWQWEGEATASPTPIVGVTPSPVPKPSGVSASGTPLATGQTPSPLSSSVTPVPSTRAYAWKVPLLRWSQSSSGSAQASNSAGMAARATARPTPNFAAEEDTYFAWKKRAWLANILLLWGGAVCLVLVAPHWWQWYLRSRVWW